MLNNLITSKTRLRLLIKFFVSQANRGYLNGLATEFKESTNSIRKELNHLSEAGYLNKYKDNNKVAYKANTSHPFLMFYKKLYSNIWFRGDSRESFRENGISKKNTSSW